MSGEARTSYDPKVLRQLMMRQAIAREGGTVVRAAGSAIRLLSPDKKSGMLKNQVGNVVSVAVEAQNVDVITNFIRYQIGRASEDKTWRYRGFGLQVIQDIEGKESPVGKAARRVACAVAEQVADTDKKAVCEDAHLELARLYLGYLNRCFVYGFETGQWDDFHLAKGACEDVP
jgi:hypothetical protein